MSILPVATETRREAIISAVIEQISSSETGDVAMSEVVRQSGAALKTIYKAFGSKDQLLAEALIVWHRGVVERATSGTPALEAPTRVAQYLERSLAEFAENRGMTRLLVRNFSTPDARIAAILAAMQRNADELLANFLAADRATLTLTYALSTYGLTTLSSSASQAIPVIDDIRAAAMAALTTRAPEAT